MDKKLEIGFLLLVVAVIVYKIATGSHFNRSGIIISTFLILISLYTITKNYINKKEH